MIESLGLSSLVTLHGYRPDDELDRALDQADLVLNLRLPTVGECSLNQLRAWEHALPTLVTPVGACRSLPDDAVAFVPIETEESVLHRDFRALLSDPTPYRRMGAAGHAHLLKHHSPEFYVDTIAQFASATATHALNHVAGRLADRVGRTIGRWQGAPPESAEPVFASVTKRILGLMGQSLPSPDPSLTHTTAQQTIHPLDS